MILAVPGIVACTLTPPFNHVTYQNKNGSSRKEDAIPSPSSELDSWCGPRWTHSLRMSIICTLADLFFEILSISWPAIVTPDPWSDNEYLSDDRIGCIYHVEFLGRNRTHLWLSEEKVSAHLHTCTLPAYVRTYRVLTFTMRTPLHSGFHTGGEGVRNCLHPSPRIYIE